MTHTPTAQASRAYVLAATIVGSAMAFIDGSVVNIALPAMQKDLSASIVELQWVSNSYLLMLGALILVGGGLGDRLGRRRIFLVGVVGFTAASLLCALAPSVEVLIAARAAQGIGAALLVPQSLAIIAATFPKDVRGKAIGTWAAASSVTTALGPPLGGFLIDALSWRAAFWINLPLAAITLWLAWRFVPESRDETATGKIDWLGAVVAVLAFGALTYGLSALSEEGGVAFLSVVLVIAGLAGVAVYILVELRAANPITPPSLFHSRVFTSVNIATVFIYGALAGVLFLLPFDLQARRGLSAAQAGLVMLPFSLIIGFLSRYVGSLADKSGPRMFLTVGPAVFGVGCVIFALNLPSLWVGVVLPVLLVAIGMAILVSPLTTAVMNAVPDAKTGAASGISNAASRLAGVLAIAIFGATAALVFSWGAPDGAHFGVIPPAGEGGRPAVEAAFLSAYSAAMVFAAVWCFIAAAISWVALAGTGPAKPAPAR